MFTINITYEDRIEAIQDVTGYWITQGCLWMVNEKTENRVIIVLEKVLRIDVEYDKK